ncbi:MAG: DNA cytosine methyltransferase [Hormoscilla sp. GM7CHS1pb]|nr:DNA cytosine methyltransferase [Hormoscilla sp. GM7CHS1pb]
MRVELFAGMASANIETVWANDISERSCRVYQSNFGQGAIVR